MASLPTHPVCPFLGNKDNFPEGSGSKLVPNWKGIYKVKEILDKNTYMVSLEGNERKKHVVHRHRLRSINNLRKQQIESKTSGEAESHAENKTEAVHEESTEKKKDEKLASEQTKKPQLILKESDKTPERKTSVVQRPKRNAAIRARDKMINMR